MDIDQVRSSLLQRSRCPGISPKDRLMHLVDTALVNNAPSGSAGSAASGAQIFKLKNAITLQAEDAAELLAPVPTPPAAWKPMTSSGTLGTQLNAYV